MESHNTLLLYSIMYVIDRVREPCIIQKDSSYFVQSRNGSGKVEVPLYSTLSEPTIFETLLQTRDF